MGSPSLRHKCQEEYRGPSHCRMPDPEAVEAGDKELVLHPQGSLAKQGMGVGEGQPWQCPEVCPRPTRPKDPKSEREQNFETHYRSVQG